MNNEIACSNSGLTCDITASPTIRQGLINVLIWTCRPLKAKLLRAEARMQNRSEYGAAESRIRNGMAWNSQGLQGIINLLTFPLTACGRWPIVALQPTKKHLKVNGVLPASGLIGADAHSAMWWDLSVQQLLCVEEEVGNLCYDGGPNPGLIPISTNRQKAVIRPRMERDRRCPAGKPARHDRNLQRIRSLSIIMASKPKFPTSWHVGPQYKNDVPHGG